MTDYYETKSQPITKLMVWQAYKKVKSNMGSAGIDRMDWEDLDSNLSSNLYKLWNRLTSGSYFPVPVKQVKIPKKDGGVRKLGIPTLLVRIAQQVVRAHLERKLEPLFHESSFGYRPNRNAHQAVNQSERNCFGHDFVVDLDIKGKGMLLPRTFVSIKSRTAILGKFREMRIHKWRKPIKEVANRLNPVIKGLLNYYHKLRGESIREVWNQLNHRLLKWVKWEKGLYKWAAVRWLKQQYKSTPNLFEHWNLVQS
ncbi:reverse transcriptase domain-containing protein [Belliella kenyensis]|uniref:Reverse transcriptase domain-containing protein n=1 Tax=Belliella kenyensis TaxID=1472724 RepID=A0ABV8EKB8_9BACT|nr:reverse transcriptase domain-containing protein [Belliella kenyensis]MCH7403260.1 reverse transcriptase domain-containing protein [Belliella kenyensis]MDN3602902.1 reverse transcriptase domain-containing protein [Belliella kenyensis]